MGFAPRARAWVLQASQCHDDEVQPLVLSFAVFGLVLASYFFLLPLRDEAGVALGPTVLPILFAASLLLTVCVAPVVTSVLQKHSDKSLGLCRLYAGIAASVLGFFVVYRLAGSPHGDASSSKGLVLTGPQLAVRCAFYLWVSLTNLVGVATVWARSSDVFTPEAGARLFGIIGAGATTGQLLASLVAAGTARLPIFQVGGVSLVPMILSACCLAGAARLALLVQITPDAAALAHQDQPHVMPRPEPSGTAEVSPWSSLVRGVAMIRASPYLQRLCVFMVLNYFVSSLFYFEKTIIVAKVPSAGARTTWFAAINSASASIILVLQLTVTGRVIGRLGAGAIVVVLPLATAALQGGLSLLAVPTTVAVAEVCRKVLAYTLARPAREVLFTVLRREEKYEAKVFMDTAVQRVGDVAAAAAFAAAVPALGLSPRQLALCAVPVCFAWAAVARSIGSHYTAAATARLLDLGAGSCSTGHGDGADGGDGGPEILVDGDGNRGECRSRSATRGRDGLQRPLLTR